MTDKNRPDEHLGKSKKKRFNDTSLFSQYAKLLIHFKTYRRLTTLQAREDLGIMHPSGRTRELIGQGHIIVTLKGFVEPDATGLPHRIALYVYIGNKSKRNKQIAKKILSSGINDRIKAASKSLIKAKKLADEDAIKICQEELHRLLKELDKEVMHVSNQDY